MSIRVTAVVVSLLVVGINAHGQNIQAKTKTPERNENFSYRDVLDSVFSEFFVGRGTGYGISIRYTPSRGNEMQVSAMEDSQGGINVVIITPVKISIQEQFDNYVNRHPKATFAQVVKNIEIHKQSLYIFKPEIRAFREEVLDVIARSVDIEKDTLPRPGPVMVPIHSDGFELRFYGVSHIRLYGESPDESPEPAFIKWMKEKRTIFERRSLIKQP